MIVAIDGPSASGKGTLARNLAKALDFAHLDTGQIYRAVAAKLLESGASVDDLEAARAMAATLGWQDLERSDLRDETVSQAASKIAAMPGVRAALLGFQRRFARTPPGAKAGAVLDGRDTGSVVCPEAQVKFFVTADLETRARRRLKELLDRGEVSIYARVLQDMRDRDARDSGRAAAPLRRAEDAILLDTTGMDENSVLETALEAVAAHRGRTK